MGGLKETRSLRAGWALLLALAAQGPGTALGQVQVPARPQNPVESLSVLSAADMAEVAAALRLKKDKGDQAWPGFGSAVIPVILYNEGYEFLLGEANPPDGWTAVETGEFEGRPYFRRAAGKPQAFAVRAGIRWAGSIGTLEMMSRKGPLKLSPDFYIAAVLHEMFHAFQAGSAPERFDRALAAYKEEGRYPFKDKEFAEAWKDEGAALAGALKAADDPEAVRRAQEFLTIRDARRVRAGLGPELLGYERELEWLEGLAKYAEVYFEELIISPGDGASGRRPRPGFFPLTWDFARLANNLGGQEGDLRFYMSGMAQARLLDRFSPGWKEKSGVGRASLEDLLRAVVGPHVSVPLICLSPSARRFLWI